MKVYISGPITGLKPKEYKRNFRRATWWLLFGGHEVINPVDMLAGINFDYEQYMQIDLAAIRQCDAIYLLKGWERSEGAKREKAYADAYHIPAWIEP